MHHPASAASTEPASHWPLKGSGAGGGGGGRFIPAIKGASGKQGRADGAPARPPAHRPPPCPSHLALNWGGSCRVFCLWPSGEQPTLVLAGPPRPTRGCQQGLRAPTQACVFPVSRLALGPMHCCGAHTAALGARPGQCQEQEVAPQHLETSAPQPCGARQQAMAACWFGETRVPDPAWGDQQKGAWRCFHWTPGPGRGPPRAGPRSWTSLQMCPTCRLRSAPSSLGDVSVSEATE